MTCRSSNLCSMLIKMIESEAIVIAIKINSGRR